MLACISAQAQVSEFDRFELYTACAPVFLAIEDLSPDAVAAGLTKDAITTSVRSRLRSARIYNSELETPILYVNVNVVGAGFSIALEFGQMVTVPIHGLTGLGVTWSVGTTGTHTQDPGFILQSISQYTDVFIDEYLAVNESACE